MLILLDPGVQFKAIEGDALGADGDFRELWSYLRVEPVAVHAEVKRRVTKADEARKEGCVVPHAPPARGVAVFQVLRLNRDGVVDAIAERRRRARPVCPLATMDGDADGFRGGLPHGK